MVHQALDVRFLHALDEGDVQRVHLVGGVGTVRVIREHVHRHIGDEAISHRVHLVGIEFQPVSDEGNLLRLRRLHQPTRMMQLLDIVLTARERLEHVLGIRADIGGGEVHLLRDAAQLAHLAVVQFGVRDVLPDDIPVDARLERLADLMCLPLSENIL